VRARDFLLVTKPGIVVGNVAAAVGAFFVGSSDTIHWTALLGLMVGTICVIAASCVVNNYLDRDIDAAMSRTKNRPSVTGALPLSVARWYAAGLYVVGFGLLFWLTNGLTALIGAFGAVLYTIVYGYEKRHTPYATLIGAFPGATPPLAGYVAAAGHLDYTAFLVFAMMFTWQMPHFYAISIFRQRDYEAAHVPVMPSVHGLARTVWEMRLYALIFVVLGYLLAHSGHTGFMFGVAIVAVGAYWIWPMFSPNWRSDSTKIARLVFHRSLLVLLIFSFFMAMTHVLL
jgi:protoheme IX farnesyltransferase